MSDVPPTSPQPAVPASEDPLVQWRAVLVGALVGLGILIALSVISALLDHYLDDFDNSGWIYPLFVGVLVGYAVAGYVAGRSSPDGAFTNGTLAGLGAFVLWIPVRILIWLVRDENKGLFSGHSAVLRPGQIFGHLVIASALGMFGGWLGARAVARARNGTGEPRGPSTP
jgi:multisubunit Na+/H+ antiporter MnhB subunit